MSTTKTILAAAAAILCSAAVSAQGPAPGEVRTLEGDGTNPTCLMGDRAMIGSMWHGRIDASLVGGQGAILILSSGAWPGGALKTDFGEILIDLSQRIYTLSRPLVDNQVQFGIPVPNDPALLGERYFAQGLVYGRVQSLCNALEISIGQDLRNNNP